MTVTSSLTSLLRFLLSVVAPLVLVVLQLFVSDNKIWLSKFSLFSRCVSLMAICCSSSLIFCCKMEHWYVGPPILRATQPRKRIMWWDDTCCHWLDKFTIPFLKHNKAASRSPFFLYSDPFLTWLRTFRRRVFGVNGNNETISLSPSSTGLFFFWLLEQNFVNFSVHSNLFWKKHVRINKSDKILFDIFKLRLIGSIKDWIFSECGCN